MIKVETAEIQAEPEPETYQQCISMQAINEEPLGETAGKNYFAPIS